MEINNLIIRLRDIAWDFPPEHSIKWREYKYDM